eukprot:TRINITY_DN2899_c0_g1_i2.p1 TRINITY_DN2899_c0_g1~~TRINITY_DN2899_c0_g1_i2.p1  ORF type:complete len:155 (-),score=16.86 TRINITY_DN2899_c0_g1_i2:56-520(-)
MMSQPSRALLWFLKLANIPHNVHIIKLAQGQHITNKDFAKINPLRQVPSLHDQSNGHNLRESSTIVRYLAATRDIPDYLYPSDPVLRSKVEFYLDWHPLNFRAGAAGSVGELFLAPMRGKETDQGQLKRCSKIVCFYVVLYRYIDYHISTHYMC